MTSTQGGSPVARRQLGRRLRRLRLAAGKVLEDVEEASLASRTKMWRIEAGKCRVKQADALALARFYGVAEDQADELVALAAATSASALVDASGAVSPWLGPYADFEATCSTLSEFRPELLGGLLQTPEYARAVISARDDLSTAAVEERVAFRMARQRAFFDRPRPGRLDFVTTAGALHLVVGSAEVMAAQIAHLQSLVARLGVSIRVLPFTSGVHVAMDSPIMLMDFDDPDDPSLVYLESWVGSRYVEQPEYVGEFRFAFERIRARAVTLEDYLGMSADLTTPWIKASLSNGVADCVEQRRNGDTIEIRDSKDGDAGPILRFTKAEFAAWLDGAKSGEFDHLA